jgi:hypothetical protein
MKQIFLNGTARTAFAACLAAGALAACNQNGQTTSAPTPAAALPLEMTATTPTAIAPAPMVSNLPPAPPVRVGRLSDPDDTYAYADEADSENEAFGDAPPDYAVDYSGTQPWIWYGDDHSERVAEPLPGGGYRYYYYQPGAQYPYLVRDPEYSYGYDSGVLVVVYDRYGEVMPPDAYNRRIDAASRILARGAALFLASQQQQHQAIAAANWEARQDRIAADNAAWRQAQAQQRGWAAYHASHAQQEQAQWSEERFRREAEAARFAQATNHPDVAQRDWQAAQQAHVQAPVTAPGLFGLRLGGPKPPAPGAAAPLAPAGPPLNAHPAGEHPAEGHGAPPTAAPLAPAGPPAGGPGQGGHDHRTGPGGGQPASILTPRAEQPPPPAAPPSRPEFHAAPTKSAPPAQIFHPAPAAPPKAFERPSAPIPRAEAVHAPPPVVHAAPVVRAPPPVARVAPAVPPKQPPPAKPKPDDKPLLH